MSGPPACYGAANKARMEVILKGKKFGFTCTDASFNGFRPHREPKSPPLHSHTLEPRR